MLARRRQRHGPVTAATVGVTAIAALPGSRSRCNGVSATKPVGRALHPVLTLDARFLFTVSGRHRAAAENVVLRVLRSASALLH